MVELTITEFTDPGCPFAWSAEPFRLRLEWLFDQQLSWSIPSDEIARPSDGTRLSSANNDKE